MNILQVIPNLETGGAQKLLEYLLPYLTKDNDVEMVVFKRNESEIEKKIESYGIKIHNLNVSYRSPLAIYKLRNHIKKADVVHVHLFPANYYAVLANIGIDKPLFFTEHSTHNKRRDHKLLRGMESWMYRHFSGIACISEDTQKNLEVWTQGKTTPEKLQVIENGINLGIYKDYSATKSQEEIFGRSGLPVLMISRFVESKDHASLVRALSFIDDNEVFVAFAGDGPLRTQIEELTDKLGLTHKVVFLGKRNDIPDIIQSSFIGVQSSNWEGFGLTAIEMMAGGLPVIASDVKGLNSIVEGAGMLFEKGNPEILAEKINLLLHNPDLYESLKIKGYQRANNFSIGKTAEKYLEMFSRKHPLT